MSESSNPTNPNIKTAVIPPVEGGTEQKEAPQPSTSAVEKHTGLRGFIETRTGKVAAAAAGIALLGGGGIGIGFAANSGKAPEKTSHNTSALANPSHSAEATPSATPTPEATALPNTYNYGVTQADIAPLQVGDVYALNTGTVENKATLAMFYEQTLPAFAQNWASISKNPKDAMLPAKVGADNTPDEINAFLANAHRQAVTLATPDYKLDPNADKVLAASFINGTLSPAYKSLSEFSKEAGTGTVMSDGSALAVSNYLQLPIINKAGNKYTDAAGRTCVDMNVTQNLNGGAAPIMEDMTACLVTNEHGSIWMQRQ